VQMAQGVYESSRSGKSIPLWEEADRKLSETHRKVHGV
jgi:hypothetical protein